MSCIKVCVVCVILFYFLKNKNCKYDENDDGCYYSNRYINI